LSLLGQHNKKGCNMPKIVIYTTQTCPYCIRVKQLLQKVGLAFEEINLSQHPERREEMLKKTGGRTSVPQIFMDGVHVGGSDDLYRLYKDGKLTSHTKEKR